MLCWKQMWSMYQKLLPSLVVLMFFFICKLGNWFSSNLVLLRAVFGNVGFSSLHVTVLKWAHPKWSRQPFEGTIRTNNVFYLMYETFRYTKNASTQTFSTFDYFGFKTSPVVLTSFRILLTFYQSALCHYFITFPS